MVGIYYANCNRVHVTQNRHRLYLLQSNTSLLTTAPLSDATVARFARNRVRLVITNGKFPIFDFKKAIQHGMEEQNK